MWTKRIRGATRGVVGILLAAALGLASPVRPVEAGTHDFEQSVEVEGETVLQVDNHEGFVLVQGWDEPRVLVTADHGGRARVELVESRLRLRVLVAREHRGGRDEYDRGRGTGRVELVLRVPRSMEVRVEGQRTDVELEGLAGVVDVEVLDGDVFLDGGRDRVYLRSVQGSVHVRGSTADLELSSTNEDVEVRDCTGRVEAESVNGDVRMQGVVSRSVEAITTQGDILYDGTLESDGDYHFSTHQGDIAVGVSPEANLRVSVATYDGELETDLEVSVDRLRPGQRVEFEIGDGRGRLRLESFSGDIHLFDPKRGRSKRG